MRISADPNSMYYDPDKVNRTRVFLNGEQVHMIEEASEEEGWVTEVRAEFIMTGKGPKLERKTGKVEIKINPNGIRSDG